MELSCPEKKLNNFFFFNFLASKNLIKLLKTFLAPKNLIKLFYTLGKTPLGETGCLSNLYDLLAAQASKIHFQNYSLKKYIFDNCFL